MTLISRKPKHLEESVEEEGRCRSGNCPLCGKYLCDWEQFRTCNYCENCGQKLNWRWGK